MDSLKKIFGSLTRVKVLQQLLLNPGEEYYIRELTRLLNEQINSLRRELNNLEEIGILKSREKNRKKFYMIDPFHPFIPELTRMMRKSQQGFSDFVKKIKKVYQPKMIIFSGQFMMQQSATDLLIVGSGEKNLVHELIEKEMEGVKIGVLVLETDDFLQRLRIGDTFITEMLLGEQNLVAYNKLKREMEPILTK